MEEWVDIWTREGVPTGRKTLKSEAHREGLFHPTIHLWIYNSQKQVLLQQRSDEKKTFPGKWDVSVAGHISAGDSPEASAIRESREELGLKVSPEELEFVDVMLSEVTHSKDLIDREFHHIYCIKRDLKKEDFVLQEEEVQDINWFDVNQLSLSVTDPGSIPELVPFDKAYLQCVLNHLSSKF